MNLTKILIDHKLWLNSNGKEGERANLKGANLGDANLSGANLKGANLSGAYLISAYLEGANLRGANLYRAYLISAYLEGANLKGANLSGANLKGASLESANLKEANLAFANLEGVNLESADLKSADLDGIKGKQILTFSAGKHFAYACDGNIKIGCKTMTISEWLDTYEQLGEQEGYTKQQIHLYGNFIKLVSLNEENVNDRN